MDRPEDRPHPGKNTKSLQTYTRYTTNGCLSHRAAEERELQRQLSRRLPSRGMRLPLGNDSLYPPMQVSEFTDDHPYWGTLRKPRISNMNSRVTHVAENKPINNNRALPKQQQAGRTTEGRRQRGMRASARNRGQAREKQFIMPRDKMVKSEYPPDIPTRTSSQRKTLNRFTRQLTKYAEAAKAAGSKSSYHTIQQLLPYRKEFQKAGLAVTSAEQSQRSPIKPRKKPVGTSTDLDRQYYAKSEESCSSFGSYVEFTPGGGITETIPTLQCVSKQKSPSQGKMGPFPWLKKKSPTTEPRSTARDMQCQSRAKAISPQGPQKVTGLRKPHAFKDLPALPPAPPKPINPPPRPIRPFAKAVYASGPPPRPERPEVVRPKYDEPPPEFVNPRASPGPVSRQSATHTGLHRKDGTTPRKPRPETIEEEKESSPARSVHAPIQIHPPPEPKGKPGASPQTTTSTVPSLPHPARHASRRPSSLERALDEVSEQLDRMERQADRLDWLRSRPSTLIENTNQNESHPQQESGQQPPTATQPCRPRSTEEIIFPNQKKLPTNSPDAKPKPLPLPPKPTRNSASPHPKQSPIGPLVDKTLPKLPQQPTTEELLNNLDAFFNYNDADINDRDVIKGLQVAIRAAADNTYDEAIRDKTGLRIRRFLADLRVVGEMQQENSKDERGREIRTSRTKA
ncbi:hypothetical protein F5B19DRAFT_485667 [Rostrohypoxylon terebratum]|nr:hypothetical protein F5B19DRAFT_485667 [Rostrohypoxylon terebratum]